MKKKRNHTFFTVPSVVRRDHQRSHGIKDRIKGVVQRCLHIDDFESEGWKYTSSEKAIKKTLCLLFRA
ncbi:hypothetical protein PAHAL_3G166400 [Panicum hallii]|jgi:hypothetical protein|uniref:Uncharacterized protein n=1 Tax=Panicum hallii TaxID=206008 RepID=A0A2S3H9A8_9POAL|nr:hypothetical protein PAHAL_3G166400 [Panicum hallii]